MGRRLAVEVRSPLDEMFMNVLAVKRNGSEGIQTWEPVCFTARRADERIFADVRKKTQKVRSESEKQSARRCPGEAGARSQLPIPLRTPSSLAPP